jgi:hypothetical protein
MSAIGRMLIYAALHESAYGPKRLAARKQLMGFLREARKITREARSGR